MKRQGELSQEDIIENIALRLKNLENAATRRMLPPDYEFIETAGQLLVRRVSDGATTVIL